MEANKLMRGRGRGETNADANRRPRSMTSRWWRAVTVAAALVAPMIESAPATAVVAATPCNTAVHVEARWGTDESWAGSVLTVTVTNSASTPTTLWSVTSPLASGQSLGSIWHARGTVSGGVLAVHNDPDNGALAPGASTTFGVQISGGNQIPSLGCVSDAARPAGDTVVTEVDNGRMLTVVLGDTVTVRLGQDWQPPELVGGALELISVEGGYPTGEPVEAVYRATWGPPSRLQSHTDYDCFHTAPMCARPSQLWSISVSVAVP